MIPPNQEKALNNIDRLPQNWRNIKATLRTIVLCGKASYQLYRPHGRAFEYNSRYNKIWDSLSKYAAMVNLKIEYVPGPRGGRWTSSWVLSPGFNSLEVI